MLEKSSGPFVFEKPSFDPPPQRRITAAPFDEKGLPFIRTELERSFE